MFLAEFGSSVDSEAISTLNELAALSRILAVITHGDFHTFSSFFSLSEGSIVLFLFVSHFLAGKAKAALKGAATSVLQQLHKHAFTPTEGSHIQR